MVRELLIQKKGLSYFILFFTIFILFCIVQPGRLISLPEFGWIFLKIFIAVFLLYRLFLKNKHPFSLTNVLYIFFLTFFVLAPIGQYFNGDVFWGVNKESHNILNYYRADVYIIIFLMFFSLGLKINLFKKIEIINRTNKSPFFFISVITIIHVLIFVWLLKNIGFPEMLFRFSNNLGVGDTALGLIVSKYVKALSIAIILYLFNEKVMKTLRGKILILINIVLFLLIFFPTSAARFQIIAVYLGLFIVLFRVYFSKHSVNFLFLLGLFVVFPALEVFRNVSSFDDFGINDIGKSISSAFSEAHYDSYQMFVNSINYVTENGITWGNQLLGVFLFFVPRSIWTNKPIGSGAQVAENMSFSFSNVSMPIIGEGYINFGVVGVIIFGLFIGVLCRYFDNKYWVKIKGKDNGIFVHFYPVLLGYFFFMNRGDLMSSFAFIIGLYLAFFTINSIKNIFSVKI